jgi:hypothetical protein
VLSLVCVPGSIHYIVVPGRRRDDVLNDPELLDPSGTVEPEWWRLQRIDTAG